MICTLCGINEVTHTRRQHVCLECLRAYEDPLPSIDRRREEDMVDKIETLLGYLKTISKIYYFDLPMELPRVIKEADEYLEEYKSKAK